MAITSDQLEEAGGLPDEPDLPDDPTIITEEPATTETHVVTRLPGWRWAIYASAWFFGLFPGGVIYAIGRLHKSSRSWSKPVAKIAFLNGLPGVALIVGSLLTVAALKSPQPGGYQAQAATNLPGPAAPADEAQAATDQSSYRDQSTCDFVQAPGLTDKKQILQTLASLREEAIEGHNTACAQAVAAEGPGHDGLVAQLLSRAPAQTSVITVVDAPAEPAILGQAFEADYHFSATGAIYLDHVKVVPLADGQSWRLSSWSYSQAE